MAYREIISAELRFKIFKRDNFTCQYCGRKAPDVVLELDHIRPVSKGGDKRESNLITACYDCNRGKKDFLVPQMEDKTAQEDFEENFQKYKQRYGYYTNYIAKVIRNETRRKPIKLYIDQFVNRSFKTEEDFNEFKKEFSNAKNAIKIVRTCIKLGLSYKAYKLAFTDKINRTIDDFEKDKEEYAAFEKLKRKIYECTKEKGHGKDSFKNNMMQTVMEYFIAMKYENGENFEINKEKDEIEKYVDRCAEIFNNTGKEYIYWAMFSVIGEYFVYRKESDKNMTLLNILPKYISVSKNGVMKHIKKFKP